MFTSFLRFNPPSLPNVAVMSSDLTCKCPTLLPHACHLNNSIRFSMMPFKTDGYMILTKQRGFCEKSRERKEKLACKFHWDERKQ